MGSIIAMGFVILVTIALAVTTMYILYRALANLPPGKARLQRDLQKLKGEIAPWFSELVPMDTQEMEKLSLNRINNKVKRGIATKGKGVFTSIYHEPMIAYAFRKYKGRRNHTLLYARTSNHEYAFHIKEKETDVWLDGEALGKLQPDGSLLSARSGKLLAKVSKTDDALQLPVIVNGKMVASLANPEKARSVNPRAFELVKPMQKDEEAVLMSMAIKEMLGKEVEK